MASHIETSRKFEWTIHNFLNMSLKTTLYTDYFKMFLNDKEAKLRFLYYMEYEKFEVALVNEFDDIGGLIDIKCCIRTADNQLKFKKELDMFSSGLINNEAISLTLFDADEVFDNPKLYLVNNSLTLILSVYWSIKDPKAIKPEQCSSNCHPMLLQLMESKSYSDFEFICSDGIRLPTHRFILAHSSPVLKAMVDTQMVESVTNSATLTDIDSETVREMLRFIYIQKVNNIEKLAEKLLYAAEKYEIYGLKDLCNKYIKEDLSTKNAVEYLILADRYNSKDLLESCCKFITSNYDKIIRENKDWNKLEKIHLLKILDYTQNNPERVCLFESSL